VSIVFVIGQRKQLGPQGYDACGKEKSTAKTVRDIMSTELTTLRRNDSLQLARDILTLGRIRHFPAI
jgi:hypothetical protein